MGEALGVPPASVEGDNLDKVRELDSALVTTRRNNQLAVSGQQPKDGKIKSRRSSAALMAQTEALFAGDSREEEVEVKNHESEDESDSSLPPPGVGGSSQGSKIYASINKSMLARKIYVREERH